MKKNTKLDSLSELIDEIDTWIDILQHKKEILNYAAEKDQNKFKKDFENDFKLIQTYKKLLDNNSKAINSNKAEFTSYSINISNDYYEMLKKAAQEADESVSMFLKAKYLYYLFKDMNEPQKIKIDAKELQPILDGVSAKGGEKKYKTIAIALDYNDNKKITELKTKLKFEKERDIIKFCVAQFVSDNRNKIKKEDYDPVPSFVKFFPCESSNLSGYDYDESAGTLYIRFIGGAVYAYYGVSRDIWLGLCNAQSKGKYFNQNIRDNKELAYEKIK